MRSIQLRNYDNSGYRPGRSFAWRLTWLFVGLPLMRCGWLPISSLRIALLRLFGASVGEGVVIHSEVSIKYPWHLIVGNDSWIGERCWIDNLTTVHLGSNVCLSQGAYLCTGNHDWKDPGFGLRTEPININDGAWVGAMAIVLPGTMIGEGSVVTAGSVIAGNVPPYEIFGGNPAGFLRKREVRASLSTSELEAQR